MTEMDNLRKQIAALQERVAALEARQLAAATDKILRPTPAPAPYAKDMRGGGV